MDKVVIEVPQGQVAKVNKQADGNVLVTFENVEHWKLIKSVDEVYSWIDNLPEVVKIGIYDMIYQLGIKGFGSFVNTQKYLKLLDYNKAIENIKNSKWAKQTPRRANNLIKRLERARV